MKRNLSLNLPLTVCRNPFPSEEKTIEPSLPACEKPLPSDEEHVLTQFNFL